MCMCVWGGVCFTCYLCVASPRTLPELQKLRARVLAVNKSHTATVASPHAPSLPPYWRRRSPGPPSHTPLHPTPPHRNATQYSTAFHYPPLHSRTCTCACAFFWRAASPCAGPSRGAAAGVRLARACGRRPPPRRRVRAPPPLPASSAFTSNSSPEELVPTKGRFNGFCGWKDMDVGGWCGSVIQGRGGHTRWS